MTTASRAKNGKAPQTVAEDGSLNISAAELRMAADLVAKVSETVPELARHIQPLLDRAAKLEEADAMLAKPPGTPRK